MSGTGDTKAVVCCVLSGILLSKEALLWIIKYILALITYISVTEQMKNTAKIVFQKCMAVYHT